MANTDRTETWNEELKKLQEEKGFETAVHIAPPEGKEIRISPEVGRYLEDHGETLEELVKKPTIVPPKVDDSQPFTHYFISSSHNTYLLSRQILGRASALSYVHVLLRHARCIELDVWPGLIVTHGYTLSTSVPLAEVCEAIRFAVRPGDWPVFASLECHVAPAEQDALVKTMRDAWGEMLVDAPIDRPETQVCPKDLKGRIIVMVEYYPEQQPFIEEEDGGHVSDSSSDAPLSDTPLSPPSPPSAEISSKAEEHAEAQGEYKGSVKKITDTLAALGVYARSMKPQKGWLTEGITEPVNVLINISESALSALVPNHAPNLIEHATRHLRRVYPRGTRVRSTNLNPALFWRNGSHIAALNWQKYDRGTQFNEAMFAGTPGYVLKPARLLPGADFASALTRKKRLECEVIGLSSLPVKEGTSTIGAYIIAQLHSSDKTANWRSKTVKCENAKDRGHQADIVWDETFNFTYDEDDLVFLRILVYENVSFGRDIRRAVFVARTEYLTEGLRLVRLLDVNGKDTNATLLVRFAFATAE